MKTVTQDIFILADVGGTNARLAYGTANGVITDSIRRYRNDDYDGFVDVLDRFLTDSGPCKIAGGCFAIAGPISGGTAKLTNRSWVLDRSQIEAMLEIKPISLINDMSALGHTIPRLPHDQIAPWHTPDTRFPNGQSLVVGLGTGVNVAARAGSSVLASEVGHAGLSFNMATLLQSRLGLQPSNDATVEDYLSGRGLEAIYEHLSGKPLSGADVCAAASNRSDDHALAACDLYAQLAGEMLRELAVHFLPMDGIYLAGSVARGIFQTPSRHLVTAGLSTDSTISSTLRAIPVSLITEDTAALHGCLHYALKQL